MEGNYLRSMLAGESRAYGFTIAFWGAGAMLINAHGVPGLYQALLYGLGAVTGFGVMAIAAFRQPEAKVDYEDPSYVVLGMMHYLASLVPIWLAFMITQVDIMSNWQFFFSGLGVSTIYNILAVLEEEITEVIARITPD